VLWLLLQPADQNVSRGRAEPGRAGQAAGQHHSQVQGGAPPLRETRAAGETPGAERCCLLSGGSSLLPSAARISLGIQQAEIASIAKMGNDSKPMDY